ncbi:MAG: hypothetical protein NHG36_09360, partial [Chromatiaceae bacterium]|nr:hypothetical protein [Candidatus Thioaporhodococcus sediminis]
MRKLTCVECGQPFEKPTRRNKKEPDPKFCSKPCYSAWAKKSKVNKPEYIARQAAKRAQRLAEALDLPIVDPQLTALPPHLRRELAMRVLARRNLLQFTIRTHPSYSAGWVHADVCRRLERFSMQVAQRKSPRLMLLFPPRHGKSELASIRLPAWHLGH